MKNLVLHIKFILISFALVSCTYQSAPPTTPVSNNIVQKLDDDEEEYEITIIDPAFERWAITNIKPIGFYSASHYKTKNTFYVSSWNQKVSQRSLYRTRDYPFEEMINYNSSVDYGIEVDYKLFWYFKYIESVYGRRYYFPG